MRKGFIFDLNKCVGCEACVVACQIENHETQRASWRSITTFNSFQHPGLSLFYFSLACNHCDDPLCMNGCPANAFSIDPLYHTVDYDEDLCIGCRYCTWTCPYDAPKYVTARGTIEKCTLCKERIIGGKKPNCANLCPTGALDFGDIENRVAIDIPGFIDKGIWPSIRVVPLRKKEGPTSATRQLTENESALFQETQFRGERKTSLRSEWPLILFTLLAALLFADAAAKLFEVQVLPPLAFMALAIAGLVVSTAHLGRPGSAWRALLNIRSSWLSREIVAYTIFIGLSGYSLLLPTSGLLAIPCILLGLATLVSIDMVYATVERRYVPIEKSGSVALTGILFFAVLAHILLLSIPILIGSGAIYIRGALKTKRRSLLSLFASGVRIAVGFVLPLLLLCVHANLWLVAMFVLIGESINRVEFYLDLDVATPRRQIEKELLKELAVPVRGQS